MVEIDYDKPRWLFSKGINLWIIAIHLIVPAVCGVLLNFTTPKHGRGFLVSEYYGLIFFQPEINGKRNISMKVISFSIKLATLVFLSFYFASLESTLRDLATFGGHSFENDGMLGVDVWVENVFYEMSLRRSVYPRKIDADWVLMSDFSTIIQENPGDYYLMIRSFADALQLQSNK